MKNEILDVQKEVERKLKKYKELNHLEHYAMFMGKAQILEFGIKTLLAQKYGYDHETMERWTLGWTTKELKKSGVREDFVELLESVVEYRNYIAHEFLANDAMLRSILGGDSGMLELKHLIKGTFELEQIIVIFDWCNEHDAWEMVPGNSGDPND